MGQDDMGQEGDMGAAAKLISMAMRSVDSVLTAICACAADWQTAQVGRASDCATATCFTPLGTASVTVTSRLAVRWRSTGVNRAEAVYS